MSREKFLKALDFFDKNYNFIVNGDKSTDEYLKDNKEALERWKKSRDIQMVSRIDISKVKRVKQTENEFTCKFEDCFTPFYKLDNDLLFHFFEELSKVELALIYFDDFSEHYRDIKQSNKEKAKQNKINEVIEMLNENSNNYETTITDLRRLCNSLDNSHFTKRRIFEHLLMWVALLLNDFKQGRKVANVTNKIIEDYFYEDITFSRATKIDTFNPYTYYYTDAKGITLYHS